MSGLNTRFVRAMAVRELRASRRRLLLYGSCMALGIAALVGLQGMRATTRTAVDAQAARLLGADLRISGRRPLPEQLGTWLAGAVEGPGRSAQVIRFGSMVLAPDSGRSRLVDVQAAEPAYPIRGAVVTTPAGAWARTHVADRPAAVVDRSLLIQLDTVVGSELALGEGRFEIVGVIERAPGGFGAQAQVAPRVLIPHRWVAATGLVTPSSMVEYLLFVEGEPERLGRWSEENRTRLEDAHLRAQTVAGQQEDLDRGFGMLTRFLGLVGLVALALGGLGVAAGVRVLVREKLDTTAMLRALGARGNDILLLYGLVALALGTVAGLLGAALGVALQWLLPAWLSGVLPVQIEPTFEPSAIVMGLVLGVWVTAIFALGPLIDLVRIPPLRALRADFAATALPQEGRALLLAIMGISLTGVAIWQAPTALVGLGFAAGLAAALLVLGGAARVAMAAVRRRSLSGAPFWLRQGIANLFRPRNHTTSTVMTVGFGLFLVATLHGIQANVIRQLALDTDAERPNLVLFDVQADQLDALLGFLDARGVAIMDRAPIVSARLDSVGGRSISERLALAPEDREHRWALMREYRLTWAAELRDSEKLDSGRWWSGETAGNEEPVEVSLESGVAQALDVRVGDVLTWDIQGVPVAAVITSIRDVDWDRLATNFIAIFPPGLIEQAPSTTVFIGRLAGETARAELQRDLVRDFPNVSVLDATVILDAVDTMMAQVTMAIRVLALFALATGLLILVAAATTARSERTREVLLLRTLGATSATARAVVTAEAVALGALATVVGGSLAMLAAWLTVVLVFELPFSPPWGAFTLLGLTTFGLSSLLGLLGGRPGVRDTPLAGLRAEASAGH